MQIFVIRHAPAEEVVYPGGSDSTRPLTSKGRKFFEEFTERIFRSTPAPDLILHSPYLRTEQTAEILAKVLDLPQDRNRAESLLAPGAMAARVIPAINSLGSDRMALVGHNPDVGALTASLIGGGSFEFKKGSIACIEFMDKVHTGLGRLVWFVSPKLILED